MAIATQHPEFGTAERACAERLIALAITEDLGDAGDLTASATIPANAQGEARFMARRPGVLAGWPVVEILAARFGLTLEPGRPDGSVLIAGDELGRVAGSMRALLSFERTALNFLQRLSGVATLTQQFLTAIAGTNAVILDTRKTTPGWRALEKYAVRCGGGHNHRMGLFDAVLIKDNHLAWLASEPDPIGQAIQTARAQTAAGTIIEVEVDTLDQFDRALECAPDIILVDNLGPQALAEAVRRRNAQAPRVLLEASGGITLSTVAELAQTGVDWISLGAITHSAPALDIGLDFGRQLAP